MVTINRLSSDRSVTHILSGEGTCHFAEWSGHLSIKTFRGGKAYYDIGNGKYAVGGSEMLIVNDSQEYQITIDSLTPVESFCVFFRDKIAKDVYLSKVQSAGRLLDNPFPDTSTAIEFVPKIYESEALESVVERLRTAVTSGAADEAAIEEGAYAVMSEMLDVRARSFRHIKSLNEENQSTRVEIYKRVCRARDFMRAAYSEPISVDTVAGVACMSTNHLIRSFKQVFRKTPYQYLKSVRLRKAAELLQDTDLPVIQICSAVGFSSHASFTTTFRTKFGAAPSHYRKKRIKSDFRQVGE